MCRYLVKISMQFFNKKIFKKIFKRLRIFNVFQFTLTFHRIFGTGAMVPFVKPKSLYRVDPRKPRKTGFSQKYPVQGYRARKTRSRARPGFEL